MKARNRAPALGRSAIDRNAPEAVRIECALAQHPAVFVACADAAVSA